MQLLNSIRYQNTLTKRFHHGTLSQHPIEWVSNWRWQGGLTNISISISFRQVCSLSHLLVLSNEFQIIIVSHARSFCFCVGNKFPDSSVRPSCSLWSPTHHAPREMFTIFVKKTMYQKMTIDKGVGEHVQLCRLVDTHRLFATDRPRRLDPRLHLLCQVSPHLLRPHTCQRKKTRQKDQSPWRQGEEIKVIGKSNWSGPTVLWHSLSCFWFVHNDLLLCLPSLIECVL